MGITPLPRRASAVRPHGRHLQLLHKKVLQLLGDRVELAVPHGTEDLGAEQMEELQVGQLQHPVRRRKEGICRRLLRQLGKTLGRFDLEGQLQGLQAVCAACLEARDSLQKDRDTRLRSYRTLGLCAGAALAILFL